MSGTPQGRPNNQINIFNKVSWTNSTVTQEQLNWDTGLNVMTYCDLNTLYYASRRTIYSNSTSMLSDELFVHIIVYIKKIVRHIFTYFVGRDEPVSQLQDIISNQIDSAIFTAFGQQVSSSTSVSQTALDVKNGYSYTVTVKLEGNMPNRVWNVIIPVSREPSSSSSTTSSSSTSSSSN